MLADAGSIPAISTNNKGHLIFRWPFLLVDLVWMRARVTGSLKSSGTILSVRFLHDPAGVRHTTCRIIPAISTNNKGHLIFRWPFLLVDLVWIRARVTGSLKSSGTILSVRFLHDPAGVRHTTCRIIPAISTNNKGHLIFRWPFLLVDLVWMRARVTGSLKSSGTILFVTSM